MWKYKEVKSLRRIQITSQILYLCFKFIPCAYDAFLFFYSHLQLIVFNHCIHYMAIHTFVNSFLLYITFDFP